MARRESATEDRDPVASVRSSLEPLAWNMGLWEQRCRQWILGQGTQLGFVIWCTTTTALSAFLVFQIQPMIAKVILPWFGGGPAVWTTCLLFFQLLLLAGYAYAHALNRLVPTQWQAMFHSIMVCGALFLLPINPDASWEPVDAHHPTWRILRLLVAHVGLPYLLLSASAPLLQAWYAAVHRDRVPYRLYALSNVGSLTALLSFPFLIEPLFDTSMQSTLWTFGFTFYALACLCLATLLYIKSRNGSLADRSEAAADDDSQPDRSGMKTWCGWLLLSALGTSALMTITNQICQEVSVVPLLWVVPLSIYLVSFIICFDRPNWFVPRWWALAAMVGILALAALRQGSAYVLDEVLGAVGIESSVSDYVGGIVIETVLLSLGLFLICMLAHGQLVRLRPVTRRLTSFYLAIASGGAAGGAMVALVCPQLFTSYLETELVLAAGFLLALWVFVTDGCPRWGVSRNIVRLTMGATVATGIFLFVAETWFGNDGETLVRMRNFYGMVRVDLSADGSKPGRALYHGRTKHGFQYFSPDLRGTPTTYFNRPSGVGVALEAMGSKGPLRVGVVGLGAGTVAAYGREDDFYHFYEINENMVTLAQHWFTFLKDNQAETKITLGDARVSLKRQPAQNFDVLVLDAFSGDAIPLHLLTVEAFKIYLEHLNADGVIAVHISNRYLDLLPVVAGVARRFQMEMIPIYTVIDDECSADTASRWVLVTHNKQLADHPLVAQRAAETHAEYDKPITWTDQYSNLLQVLW